MKTKKPRSLRSTRSRFQQKFVFVTGGVVSSIGKGLSAASLGALLEARGIHVSMMKCDPYINVDPGTMSPLQHGEVYVTDDGAETDLDLGHYERFTSQNLSRAHSITAGQIYESVIAKERRGDYLGGTVQVIPHITDEIKFRIREAAQGAEVLICEIGGTVGDIEGLPFLEAIRQLKVDLGAENCCFVHVTYVPFIAAAGELKSKPTQHSVKELMQIGLSPDILICRAERDIDKETRSKIGLFCGVPPQAVVAATDASTIYEVPLNLSREGFDKLIMDKLGLRGDRVAKLSGWRLLVKTIKAPEKSVKIAVVGKYVELKESYKSLHEALVHGGVANKASVEIEYIDSETITVGNVRSLLSKVDGVLVPGGFGERGIEGKILAIKWARESRVPFFGICLGMQLAAIEFARHVCGIKEATSREFVSNAMKSRNYSLVIDFMDEQRNQSQMGGTMRLGSYPCELSKNSLSHSIYKTNLISERHRHRFEFNNQFRGIFEKNGATISGVNPERDLVEILEIKAHPWFIGVQFHPEFRSRPLKPHPLFVHFVAASLKRAKQRS